MNHPSIDTRSRQFSPYIAEILISENGRFKVETVTCTPRIGQPGSLRQQCEQIDSAPSSDGPILLKMISNDDRAVGYAAEPTL